MFPSALNHISMCFQVNVPCCLLSVALQAPASVPLSACLSPASVSVPWPVLWTLPLSIWVSCVHARPVELSKARHHLPFPHDPLKPRPPERWLAWVSRLGPAWSVCLTVSTHVWQISRLACGFFYYYFWSAVQFLSGGVWQSAPSSLNTRDGIPQNTGGDQRTKSVGPRGPGGGGPWPPGSGCRKH